MTKISTTPAMQRFNLAVEQADDLLGNGASKLDLPGLLRALHFAGWSRGFEYCAAAIELRESAVAVGYRATVEATLSPATTARG